MKVRAEARETIDGALAGRQSHVTITSHTGPRLLTGAGGSRRLIRVAGFNSGPRSIRTRMDTVLYGSRTVKCPTVPESQRFDWIAMAAPTRTPRTSWIEEGLRALG